jgi:S-adenosyl methyltransferase
VTPPSWPVRAGRWRLPEDPRRDGGASRPRTRTVRRRPAGSRPDPGRGRGRWTCRLIEAVPSGSYLVMSHSTNAIYGAVSDEAVGQWNKFGKPAVTLRSPEQIAGFLDGLELIEPGVVSTPP